MNKEKILSGLVAIFVTAAATLGICLLSTEVFDAYSYGIFMIMPVVCGALSVVVFNRKGKMGFGESIGVSLLSGCVSLLGFLLVGFEGLICIAMSAPIVLPLFLIGGLIGLNVSRRVANRVKSDIASLGLVVFAPLFLGFESAQPFKHTTRAVETSIVIKGTVQDVWREVIAFSPIPEPQEFMFRLGIAYPMNAKITGEGVGAIRYCNFSTGSFVEPITHWEEHKRLAFDVSEQPEPMTEISPYIGIHPPHLDWAVRSERGEFLIVQQKDGTVKLLGTTWFHVKMRPECYWGWISDQMIHMIHTRVLSHIKQSVETDTMLSNSAVAK